MVVHIPDIQLKFILPTDRISTVHLSPACDAGFDIVSSYLLGTVERQILHQACDDYLKQEIELFQVDYLVGVGKFAENRGKMVCDNTGIQVVGILHPSPASPAANRDWKGDVTRQLVTAGVWEDEPAGSSNRGKNAPWKE